jgi:hypothetical protein
LEASVLLWCLGFALDRKCTRNVMRARAIDEVVRLGSKENPCKVNPARGSEMK